MVNTFLLVLHKVFVNGFVSSGFSRIRRGSILSLALLAGIGWYALRETNAHENGITGQTQKSTNAGCSCHCSSSSSSTTVTLTASSGYSPLTTEPNTTYDFTITVANSDESDGGCDISTYSGNGLTAGTGLFASSKELTHSSPKSFSGNGYCSWTFTYTTGSTPGWDTIYATGNAVNGDGSNDNGNCDDKWNWAPKFIIHIVEPTKRASLSQNSISFGQLRVGHRVADSLTVASYGDTTITISSSAMKGGSPFSSYPTTTNRSIATGSFEIDSAIFAPSSRGTFHDSLIFNTNSDTVPQQRMGIAVSGQGIQAIFNSTNGTSLAFGNLHVGNTATKTFSFSNTGDDTLFLQTPSISGSGFSIATALSTLTYPPNQSGSVVVQFAPSAKQSYSGSLSFTASDGVSAPTVSLSGNGTLPQIQVSSSDNLGSTRVGQTLHGSVTFQNVGNDTLHVSNAMLSQSSTFFSVGSYDQSVIPNGSDTMQISYTPNAEETDNATLHFSTDDPSDTAVTISISAAGALPHMVVAERNDTVNLGQIKINSSATATIGIANNGGVDLNVSSVSVSPRPFALDGSIHIVSAGTTSSVTVGFSPTVAGSFTGALIVQGDDPNNASDTVYLSGTGITTALSIDPGSIDFGQVPIFESKQDTITLSDSGKANVTIYSAQLTPSTGPFSIVGATPTQVLAGGSAAIVLNFEPDSNVIYSGILTLTTDDANTPNRTIALSGLGVKDPFTVTPSQVDFGQVPVLTTVQDTITLNNGGTSSVTISKAQLLPASGSFAIVGPVPDQVPSGGSAMMIVSFHPDTAGSYSGTITLSTSDASAPTRGISLSGTGIKGALSVNPSSINFGTVLIGHDTSITATLHNTGQASIDIDSIVLTGSNNAGFSYGTFSIPQTIAAGNSTTINVSFSPTVAGSYPGSVQLMLQDGTSINISLQGVAASAGVSQNSSELSQFSLSLSPNPAGNSVTAHATLVRPAETLLEIFDASGHKMLSLPIGMLSEGNYDIFVPTASLANGSYFVRVSNTNGDAAEAQLVIEKQ
jgi:hypothetical protein